MILDTHISHGQPWIPLQGWMADARVPHAWQYRTEAMRFQDGVQDVAKAIMNTGSGTFRVAVVWLRGEADEQYLVAHLIYDDNVVPLSKQKYFYINHLVSRLLFLQYMYPGIAVPAKERPMNRNGKLERAKVAGLPVYSLIESDNMEGQLRAHRRRLRDQPDQLNEGAVGQQRYKNWDENPSDQMG